MKPTIPNNSGRSTQQDVVMTKPESAVKILNYFQQQYNYGPESKVLEPCKGNGSFYDNMIGDKYWCEITENKDFMGWKDPVDWIITNPPYSIYDIFLKKAMSVANNIVLFVPFSKLWKSKSNELMVNQYGGIRDLVYMGTGSQHGFPMGFVVGCVYFKKNYDGPIKYTRLL